MADCCTVGVPTLSTVGNLRGKGRFREEAVREILDSALRNVAFFAEKGGLIAPGSDAGAWAVPHADGGMDEYAHLAHALGENTEAVIRTGISAIRTKF